MGVVIAMLVVVPVGLVALIHVHIHASSPRPSPTLSSQGRARISVYAFTAGSQYVDHPLQVAAQLKASRFQPDGIDWVIGWGALEPTPGHFDWAIVDNDLAAAAASGYRSFVEIIPGEYDPIWVLGACPNVHVTLGSSGKTVTMCVPTSPQFLEPWTQMIAVFGQRYDGHAGLTMVQATGCGVQGEMQLPDHSRTFWASYGVTSSTLLRAWEHVIAAWRAALPHTPSSLAIEEPLGDGNSNVLNPLIAFAQQHVGSRLWIQQNGLREGTHMNAG